MASLLADPARCKVLLALDDGRALPASVLADEADIGRPTASSHLGKLTDAGLSVETHGRHRYYRLAVPKSASYSSTGPSRPAAAGPIVAGRHPCGTPALGANLLRPLGGQARRGCHGVPAGSREALVGGDGRYDPHRDSHDALSSPGHDLRYELTDTGRGFLTGVGVEIPTGKGHSLRYCVDWTEQRHHLSGGAEGRAVFDRFLSRGLGETGAAWAGCS